ncbi:transcriptional repressor [Philodulcilactobacillus myokoensis]|uniref:Transcriptional repressor n=1 Tax=Philodulcilactobacillus myokoensis TaxID=2929573 RepID=A0A9W6B0J0_9LACO|nr:Fur family transcriptional regulator [Philodulcilactobacillus myokoensis]GLB46541.1 transcriptional repressor [Philodulcilactobacillus myokoensis]
MDNQKKYEIGIQSLKKHNVRITPQRQIILKYLIEHHNHPSVETIYDSLEKQFSNLSMATIYNTLELFEKIGIIIELPNQGGGIRYDFFGQPHFHAICENCGRITDVSSDDYMKISQHLKDEAADQTGYLLSHSKIEVYGLCPQCQKKLNKQRSK